MYLKDVFFTTLEENDTDFSSKQKDKCEERQKISVISKYQPKSLRYYYILLSTG